MFPPAHEFCWSLVSRCFAFRLEESSGAGFSPDQPRHVPGLSIQAPPPIYLIHPPIGARSTLGELQIRTLVVCFFPKLFMHLWTMRKEEKKLTPLSHHSINSHCWLYGEFPLSFCEHIGVEPHVRVHSFFF